MQTKPFNLYIAGEKIFQYKICLPCPDDYRQYIRELQIILKHKLKADWERRRIPQLILAGFEQHEYAEAPIINGLEKAAEAVEPIIAMSKHIGRVEEDEIVVPITSGGVITALIKEIRKNCHELMLPDPERNPFYAKAHYLTIFSDLSKTEFSKALRWLSKNIQDTAFVMDRIELLKREKGQEKFELVKTFELNWDLMQRLEPSELLSLI